MAAKGPCSALAVDRKRVTAIQRVGRSGVVVGMRVMSRRSLGPVPTAHTNLVPPASMAAMSGGPRSCDMGREAAGRTAAESRMPEAGVDLARGVGLVQRVEMDAVHAVVEQVAALLGGVVDADPRTASSSPPQRWMARSSLAG